MKAIKITSANATAIESALLAVNGKAEAHRYTTFAEIEEIAKRAESSLADLFPAKKHYPGAIVCSTSGDSVPNSYKYTRTGTDVQIERRSSDWFLTAIGAGSIYKQGGGSDRLILTAAQDLAAVEYLRTGYKVKA